MKHQRWVLAFLIALGACGSAAEGEPPVATPATHAAAHTVTVFKSPTCGCCTEWIAYLRRHGLTVAVHEQSDLAPVKRTNAVPPDLESCHTALVGGYVVEGHVPIAALERLLTEQPAVVGLAVPGMPLGSPGMEVPGQPAETYAVLAFDRTRMATVFERVGE